MHLNECLQLAFSLPTVDALDEGANPTPTPSRSHDYSESSVPSSSTQSQQPQQKNVQGSVGSVLQCIVSEWGTKAQTNFYIPPEHHAGYSYLYEDGKQLGGNSPQQQYTHSHLYEHHHPAFVHAEQPNNLHPHHYDVYTAHAAMSNSTHGPKMTLTAMHSSINLTSLESSSDSMHKELHHPQLSSSIITSLSANSNIHSAPMTVPYMHPHLDMPVPPLHLPLYFGALCSSFALGGAVMLYLAPKWTSCGGGLVNGERKEYRRHWYPYRSFAWILILCQSPCSFLADYVHMTNISPWHTIDRFLACILMALELGKLIVMRSYTRPIIYIINLLCCAVAIFCFLKSQKSQQTLSEDGFIFWHCGWHCYPLLCVMVRLVEHCLNQRWGEYYPFECEVKRGEGGGILLSTIAMNQCVNNAEKRQPKDQSEAVEVKEWEQTPKPVKVKKVTCHDGETAASVIVTNGMASPGLRRSRRIARQKPEVQLSL